MILFTFLDKYFTSKISNLLFPLWAEGFGGCESCSANDISNKCICEVFLKRFIYRFCCCFSTFWYSKGFNQRLKKAVVLQLCKAVRERERERERGGERERERERGGERERERERELKII